MSLAGSEDYAEPPSPALVARFFFTWWVVGAVLWLLLDDTVKFDELLDGAIACTVGSIGATLVYRQRLVELSGRWVWLRGVGRPLLQTPGDLWLLGRVLARALSGGTRRPGSLTSVRFRTPGPASERNARQALASTTGSFAPNTIVLSFDEDAEVMLVHELSPQPQNPRATDPLGLG